MRRLAILMSVVVVVSALAGCSSRGKGAAQAPTTTTSAATSTSAPAPTTPSTTTGGPAGSTIPVTATAIPGGHPSDLSCPTTTFCMVEDVENSGGTQGIIAWPVTPAGAQGSTRLLAGPTLLGGLSCGSPTFCVLSWTQPKVVQTVTVTTWDGTSWSTPTALADPTGNATEAFVSCLATQFCMLEDGAVSWTDHDGRWSSDVPLPGFDPNSGFGEVACPTEQSCVTVEPTTTDVWDGSAWHQRAGVTFMKATDLSCPAATDCTSIGVTSDYSEETSTWNGTTWAEPAPVPENLSYLRCPSASLCVADDNSGPILTLAAGKWSSARPLSGGAVKPTGLETLSCPTATRCFLPAPAQGAIWSFQP